MTGTCMTVTEIVMTSHRYLRLFLYSVTVIIMGGMYQKSVPKAIAINRSRTVPVDGPRYQELESEEVLSRSQI